MTNMKHLSPTPPTGHLTPGQKEGDNYQPNGAGKVIRKVSKNATMYTNLFYPFHPHKARHSP